MGSRPAGEGETGPVRHPDGRDRGVDAPVRIVRDQRRLGRCIADVVAPGPAGPRTHQAPGDLSGQRSEELGPTDAVLEADGPVRGLVRVGGPPGVLSAVPQQVQSDRTVLVGVGEEVNGELLNCWKVVLQCALRMKWKGRHPTVKRLHGVYPDGVRVAAKEMKQY